MSSILIAMPKYENSNKIANVLKKSGVDFDIEICSTGSEVLRTLHDRDDGVIICGKRLRDMEYMELADYLPNAFSMIILTKDISLEMPSQKMIKLIMPFKVHELLNTIEMISGSGSYRKNLKKKQVLKRSKEQQQIIDQAKAVLMDRNGMSEPEAFRYLQKSSMDSGRTLMESAQMVLMLHQE